MLHVWRSAWLCVPCFSSTTVEPAARFSVASVRPSTPPFPSLASRRKCACASPASSCLTSESSDVTMDECEIFGRVSFKAKMICRMSWDKDLKISRVNVGKWSLQLCTVLFAQAAANTVVKLLFSQLTVHRTMQRQQRTDGETQIKSGNTLHVPTRVVNWVYCLRTNRCSVKKMARGSEGTFFSWKSAFSHFDVFCVLLWMNYAFANHCILFVIYILCNVPHWTEVY